MSLFPPVSLCLSLSLYLSASFSLICSLLRTASSASFAKQTTASQSHSQKPPSINYSSHSAPKFMQRRWINNFCCCCSSAVYGRYCGNEMSNGQQPKWGDEWMKVKGCARYEESLALATNPKRANEIGGYSDHICCCIHWFFFIFFLFF